MKNYEHLNSKQKINLTFPKVVREYRFSFLFGLIYFWYIVEDRRPDLNETTEEGKEQIKELGYKYKTQFRFKFFNIEKWFINHSIRPGSSSDDPA